MAKRRLKWEPAALMVVVLGIGLWVAFGPAASQRFPTDPASIRSRVLIGESWGTLEARPPIHGETGQAETGRGESHGKLDLVDDSWTFRFWLKDGPNPPPVMTKAQVEAVLGPTVLERCLAGRNPVFRWLNITAWASLVWVAIGLVGQVLFSGRMVLQWIVSERRKISTITESFWWFSLIGGLMLLSYFVWRQEVIGILGQASGIVIYARNIRLIRKQEKRMRRRSASPALVDESGAPCAD